MLSHYLKAALTVLREEGVAELHRETNAFVDRASQRLEFECNTSKNALMNRIRYDAPPSAESPIEVDPHRITHRKEGFSAVDILPALKGEDSRPRWDITVRGSRPVLVGRKRPHYGRTGEPLAVPTSRYPYRRHP